MVSPSPSTPAPLRLVARPEQEALVSADPDDIVLYRRIDGTAHATCEHVVRHSPTGFDRGLGSGAAGRADLVLSVLTSTTDRPTGRPPAEGPAGRRIGQLVQEGAPP